MQARRRESSINALYVRSSMPKAVRNKRRKPTKWARAVKANWPWSLALAAFTVLGLLVWRYGW